MSKIDRQGVRTASDLERKYKFGQDLNEVIKVANNASRVATSAQDTAYNAANVAAESKATADSFEGRIADLEQNSGSDVGLSVVNGLLCITYEE